MFDETKDAFEFDEISRGRTLSRNLARCEHRSNLGKSDDARRAFIDASFIFKLDFECSSEFKETASPCPLSLNPSTMTCVGN
jgi:hypothetical protein